MEGLEGLSCKQQNVMNRRPWDNPVIREDLSYMLQKFGKAERFAGRTIVITGGGGFIGYYLILFFLYMVDNGTPIRHLFILDRFIRGKPEWLMELESDDWPLTVKDFDVTVDPFEFYGEADYLLHMASIASPTYYRRFPLETLEANVFGLKRLLDSCRTANSKGILFFSSSEVYGNPDPSAIPTPETYNGNVPTVGPRACYDESKRFGETLCHLYNQVHQLPIRIVRPFNNFGPGLHLDDRRISSDFARAIVRGEDIEIYSSGQPTRTYCYIADAIVGYLLALTYDRFEIFNIGSDSQEISAADMAALFSECARELTGKVTPIRYYVSEDVQYLTDNPERRCPDIGKARKLLGFDPVIPLKEGVLRYLQLHGVGE
ncbi:NAD-dependent epimerase/dehydratase family protein [Paenibacillus prosopidis]|uniref:UDP-glucuronate decarboxylase n=1 Tax=Paenibacillus prosopidis TaxID=630520 RepID=A0A368VP36_9BACL|nr:NAD-dependent epimerase/dehydratase family protein [Paenibacillus prosopidis]RCW43489.1 UDP-glucuronate decarboxylase [Paenibacillus prosopidis]